LTPVGSPVSDAVPMNRLVGQVIDVSFQGSVSAYRVGMPGGLVLRASLVNAARRGDQPLVAGQKVIASFAPDDCVVLDH
jgi:putrescine transport system ATP-binding protein